MFAIPLHINRKSRYILTVETNGVAKTLKKQKVSKKLNGLKRASGILLIGGIVALTCAAAFLTSTATASPASADDPVGDIACSTQNQFGTYGGLSSAMDSTRGGDTTAPTALPSGVEQTAAEDNYFPNFDSWVGAEYSGSGIFGIGDTSGFTGSGGNAEGNKKIAGPSSPVPDPNNSALYSHAAGDCIGVNTIPNDVANVLFKFPELTTMGADELYNLSTQSTQIKTSPIYIISHAVDTLVSGPNGLEQTLYLPFLTPLVMLGAIYLAYIGIVKRQSTVAFQGVVWMVFSAVAGVTFLLQPMLVPGAVNFVTNQVDSAINTALLTSPNTDTMCSLSANQTNRIVREQSCEIWYDVIYRNWVKGQFGVTSTSGVADGSSVRDLQILTNDPRNVLSSATITFGNKQLANVNWGEYELANQGWTSYNESEIAYAQLSTESSFSSATSATPQIGGGAVSTSFSANGVWKGGDFWNRMGAVLLASAFANTISLLLLIASFLLIYYALYMLLLVLVSPLFFLVGVVPGGGRRIMMRWFELMVVLTFKQVAVTIMIDLFLRLNTLFQGLTGIAIMFQLAISMTLAVLLLVGRSIAIKSFEPLVDFGGNKGIAHGAGGNKAKSVFAGIAGGLIGAGAAAVGMGAVGSSIAATTVGEVISPSTAPTAERSGTIAPVKPQDASSDDVIAKPTAPTKTREKTASDLRKTAIRKGGMQGAKAGFSSGKVDVFGVAAAGSAHMDQAEAKIVAQQGQEFRDQQTAALFGANTAKQQQAEIDAERRHQELLANQNTVSEGSIDELKKIAEENARTARRIDRKMNDITKQFPPKPNG